jgi:hypothetical protein
MAGQTKLLEVLSLIHVTCDEVEYGFATIQSNVEIAAKNLLGTFREAEGMTIIASKGYLIENRIPFEGPFAKLTIEIHTSLDLIGITALLSNKLAENEISSNVVAAYYYDHIFVQYHLRAKAMHVLNAMRNEL